MEEEKNVVVQKNMTVIILRWIARIWSYLVVTFIVLFVGAHLFSSDGIGLELDDAIAFAFFPIGLTVGLIIAWWKEGLGGIIATGSIIGFHLTMLFVHGKPDFVLFIELLAVPGLLFIICWLLSRKKH
ncbi:MAG: hypothetical protein KAS53_09985 [Candidatus Cloacimonetes bacterium]|nr:hypothetical protein [Candidatus Cloacimonadota bacterium]